MRKYRHTILGVALLFLLSIGYAILLRGSSDYWVDAQGALWGLPNAVGPLWWGIAAVFSGLGALTMFLYMVMNQKFSGLLMSRVVLMGAMICFALVPLNSGWLPWGVMLASFGGLYASFLIATNWCERQDKWATFRGIFHRRKAHHEHQRTGLGSSD